MLKRICLTVIVLSCSFAPSIALAETAELKRMFDEAKRLHKAKQYEQALPIAKRALAISKRTYGQNHSTTAKWYINLGQIQRKLQRYDASVSNHEIGLKIREAVGKPNDPRIAQTTQDLAALYITVGRLAEAETLLKRVLKLEQKLDAESIYFARALSNLGALYHRQGRYLEAEPLIERGLAAYKRASGPEHANAGRMYAMLASLYHDLNRLQKAEDLYKRALRIQRKAGGPDHIHVSEPLHNLALLYSEKDRLSEAEVMLKEAVKIIEKNRGPRHSTVASAVSSLAGVYRRQGKRAQARSLYTRALSIREKTYGKDHPNVASSLHDLAWLNHVEERYDVAEPLYIRSIRIRERVFGPQHRKVAGTLRLLAFLYEQQKRHDEEATIRARLAEMPEPGTRHVPVYFATNRKAEEAMRFGTELTSDVSLGRYVMQVPEDQVKNRAKRIGESLGQLEKATKGKLTSANSLKIVRSRPLKTKKQYAASIRASQTRSAIYKNQALVFVHGYNNDFEGALKRATQLSFDLQFDGILMPFTWPSKGSVTGYFSDVEMATKSVDALVGFFDQLRDTLPEIKINVLAHSLGNQVMLKALCKIAKREGGKRHNFGQIISAHADVSPGDFEKLTKCFKARVAGTTLYVNEDDTALRVRCAVLFKCRAGNYARGYTAADVIDTTQMSVGFFRTLSKGFDHDIFVRNPLLFSDIARLLLSSQRPVDKRTQEFRPQKGSKGKTYWAYDKSFNPAAHKMAAAN
ncbi:MAG: tetratricopeptide repeat protein [Filomicrobium sp.]